MKTKAKKLAAFMLSLALIFTSLPAMAGDLDVHAASYIKTLNVKVTGQTTVRLTWTKLSKKQQRKVNGIVVIRNDNVVKYLGKKTSTYTDAGLAPGHTYSYKVMTYKKTVKKVKRWYNKGTGKWQKKKPKKKDRGKRKTFKEVKYSYKNASPTRAATTQKKPTVSATSVTTPTGGDTGGTDGGAVDTGTGNSGTGNTGTGNTGTGNTGTGNTGTGNTGTGNTIPEDTSAYINVNGTQIHVGQPWTSSLETTLRNSSSKTLNFTRSKGYNGVMPVKVYLYNCDTYNPFIALYVVDGRVSGWATNGSTFFTYNNQAYRRGMQPSAYPTGTMCFTISSNSSKGALMADYGFFTRASQTDSDADERTIGFHFVNAARVAYGSPILKRSHYLEGVDRNGNPMTWSGTIPKGQNCYNEGATVQNARFGATAWAETFYKTFQATGKKIKHNRDAATAGPLANTNYSDNEVQGFCSEENIGRIIVDNGENVYFGMCGEDSVFGYINSTLHTTLIINPDMASIGMGYYHGVCCEQYSYSESEGW